MRCFALALAMMLCACSNIETWRENVARNEQANTVMPQNYKADILLLMRTYLNDPTNVRDAFVSDPVIKSMEGGDRYVVCLRYNAKKSGGQYAGSKETLFTFREGRLDKIVDSTRDLKETGQTRQLCKDLAMKPFPELEKLTR